MLNIKIEKTLNSRLSTTDFDNLGFGKIFSDHMFVIDFENGAWVNPRIEPFGPIQITPANSTLHYAQSIFEGMKAFRKDDEVLIFRPELNWNRLNASAERMCIPQLPKEIFFEGLEELLKIDQNWIPTSEGSSLYLRPFMFATEDFLGVRPSNSYKFIIITSPVGAYYNAPVKVKIEKNYVRAVKGGMGAAKTAGNYAASIYPAQKAKEEGFDQLVWTDAITHQYIEESGTMNLFFVFNDTIRTAPLGDTILDGITRRSIISLARAYGFKVLEEQISVAEIIAACESGEMKEAFGAGTAATISHIAQITYEGVDYILPEIESRTISNKILTSLDSLKRGILPDTNNWNYKISLA